MPKTVYGERGGQIEAYPIAASCHRDERGWSVFPCEREGLEIDVKTIHIVQTRPGAKRGNHRHPRAAEWVCPLEGEGLLRWRSPSGEVQELHLEAQTECIRIRPGVAHAIQNIGSGMFLFIGAREKDPEGDLSIPDTVI